MYNECLRKGAEKMALIEELGFGAFSHLPCYNLKQHMLKEVVNIYDIHNNTIHSVRGDVEITTDKIGKALGLSWNGDPFDDKVSENNLNDEDHAIFKIRCSSCPNVTPKALPTLFGLENTTGRNWALHVHDFLLKEIKKAKLNNTKAVHGCCYVMMIIYFHETHFGKNSREPEAQPPWIQFWTGENPIKRLHREQNHPTEFDSESEYESEVESSSGRSSSSSSEMDSENTMSEELVERRTLPNPTPAQQERRSKNKQDSSAASGLRSQSRPLVERALGKRKQPDRAAKSKNPNQGKPLIPMPQPHPQPQHDRAAKKARKPTHDDPVERASGKPQPRPPEPQQQPPPPQYEDLIDISSSSEDENQPPPPQFKIPKTKEAEEAQSAEEAQPQ
ncbi:hypothetical protein PIB30_027841 [Stylosanthes scabra]|uniref:Uncharacterized protein n=1 Tax=Stylosanthes scabra TaxID=79078 RepID=A0ABU6U9L0_9FABA|nr:hypothetical protein [Stylosanthes scabra]